MRQAPGFGSDLSAVKTKTCSQGLDEQASQGLADMEVHAAVETPQSLMALSPHANSSRHTPWLVHLTHKHMFWARVFQNSGAWGALRI